MKIALIWAATQPLVTISVRYERYVRGLRALGHDPVTVCLRGAERDYSEPVIVISPEQLRDPAYWRTLQLDAAILVTWLGLADVITAVRSACPHVISIADSDGQVGVRTHPRATWLRMTRQHVDWRSRLGAAKYWMQLFVTGMRSLDAPVLESCEAATSVVVGSDETAVNLAKFFVSYRRGDLVGRLQAIPYPIDECYLETPAPATRQNRLVAIGRWDDPQKHAGLLARTIETALNRGGSTQFVIFGPQSEEWFGALARRWPAQVTVAGSQPAAVVAEALRDSRAVLLVSRWESGPLVLNEALASGCSVVSVPEIPNARAVVREGDFGTLATRASATSIARAIDAEMQAWDRGRRDPSRIAAYWRERFAPREVCRRMLTGIPEEEATAPAVRPKVSVVCLSFRRPEFLKRALESLDRQCPAADEVLVVDNFSSDSPRIAEIVAGFPNFRLIAHPDNRGFTGGMNTGLRAARGDYVVITEDDIILDPGALAAMVSHLIDHPDVGLAGALMLNEGSNTVRCAGGRVRLATTFQMDVIGADQPDAGQWTSPFDVNYLPGAFIAARRSVWQVLRGFRDDYYMYLEDVDLCLRAERAGMPIQVVPACRVLHLHPLASYGDSSASPESSKLSYIKTRNLLLLYLLNAPLGVLPMFIARYYVWGALRQLGRNRDQMRNLLAALCTQLARLPKLMSRRAFSWEPIMGATRDD